MIIVFFGPPGSGKGTQAQKLSGRIQDLQHVSTGDLLRAEIASGSELGRSIQATIEAGKFPTDDLIMQFVAGVLKKNAKKDIIFDGFPRTLNQAIAFDALLGVENLKVDVVFDFDMDAQALVQRIAGRYICRECGAVYHDQNRKPKVDGVCDQCGSAHFDRRPDDAAHIIETRFKVYENQTLPVKKHYGDKGVLKRIDASLSEDKVTQCIYKALTEAGLMRRGD